MKKNVEQKRARPGKNVPRAASRGGRDALVCGVEPPRGSALFFEYALLFLCLALA